jgi:hypothetical protein
MKTLFALFFLIIATHGVHAQTVLNLQEFYKQFHTAKFQQGIINPELAIEGSPHDKDAFIPGTVVAKSDIRYEQIPLRYNIYANEMEFKTEDGTVYYLAAPEIIEQIVIGEDTYIYCPYTFGNRLLRGYFRIATSGKANLLVKQNINLKDPEPAAPYKEAIPAKFVKLADEYFVRIGEAEAMKVSSRKELLSVLTDKSREIDAYLKKNKTRFNRLEDLIQLIDYYNRID